MTPNPYICKLIPTYIINPCVFCFPAALCTGEKFEINDGNPDVDIQPYEFMENSPLDGSGNTVNVTNGTSITLTISGENVMVG